VLVPVPISRSPLNVTLMPASVFEKPGPRTWDSTMIAAGRVEAKITGLPPRF